MVGPQVKQTRKRKRRYIHGFDGLRIIGVIGVILYHLRPELFRGGYLGVPIFMVVSGYLITDGLLIEFDRYRHIDFKSFFIRRFKRLYPALITVLFGTAAYITLFSQNLLHNLHMMVLTNLLYVYNWWQILNGQSYFARYANGESPFTHLWTLSIEGQYYLIWPFLVLGLLLLVKNRHQIANIVLILAAVSGAWMAILYMMTVAHTSPAAFDPSRLYYGTDTRAFSILFGAALAFIWPSSRLSTHLPRKWVFSLDLIGTVSLVGLLTMVFTVDAQNSFLYEGGMVLFSILTTILVAVVAHPAAHFDRLLTNPLFSYIGSRSYGLYLYQFPVMIFWENRFRNIADHPVLYPVIEVILIVLITEISYRLIEQPAAHFDYHKTWDFLKALVDPKKRMGMARWISYAAVIILAIGSVGLAKAPSAKAVGDNSPLAKQLKRHSESAKEKAKRLEAMRSSLSEQKKADKNKADESSSSRAQQSRYASQAKTKPVNQDYERYGLTQIQLQQAQDVSFTAVGDSVMLDGEPGLQQLFPKAVIDAAVSRQMINSIDLVRSYAEKGVLANIVVIGLGTNGPFSDDQLAQMMQAIGPDRQVFWINVRVPTRAWQNDVNSKLDAAQKQYKNLTVIDWFHKSDGHPDWFYNDMVHMNPTGNPEYAAFVAKTILEKIDE
ncbi:acyltransferase family protein [Lacticaseibacillus rhamnosus]|uniref:acyltransferase family protein n=1 Tax=Lacticaseibacillus rhamnosus TaxID=47715 RepID=UPI002552ECBF|nr:acyltransferase family protein [Lacticaseibacillus rhamnosus]